MLFPILVFSDHSSEMITISSFEDLRWKKRIILVYENENIHNLRNALENAEEQLSNRDVLWFLLKEGKITSNSQLSWDDGLYQRIENKYFPEERNKVILIGKDGRTKSISTKLVLNSLMSLIDSMPMRRLEILEEPTKD
jgi:hypothetical protein